MNTSSQELESFDFAIVGAGVIGLSLAWELSQHGTVVLLDRQRLGREASWAGAGILPPASITVAVHPVEKLKAVSFRLHAEWAERLAQETGIDTGYRKCGALFVARTPGEVAALAGQKLEWSENDVRVDTISKRELEQLVPSIAQHIDQVESAILVPDEAQIRNPDHLRALKTACLKQNVCILEEQGNCQIQVNENKIVAIKTEQGARVSAGKFCMTAGAWTQSLCQQIDVRISTLPVRGQMLLFKLPERLFEPILYEGTRYIVPRDDGHVVVGATLEEAGFDKSTTEDGLRGLKEFASQLIPELNAQTLVDSWAGLRPASFDGFPYMGKVPDLKNAWISTAHFRSGLLLSTGSAVLMSQLMRGEQTLLDPSPFRVDRG